MKKRPGILHCGRQSFRAVCNPYEFQSAVTSVQLARHFSDPVPPQVQSLSLLTGELRVFTRGQCATRRAAPVAVPRSWHISRYGVFTE